MLHSSFTVWFIAVYHPWQITAYAAGEIVTKALNFCWNKFLIHFCLGKIRQNLVELFSGNSFQHMNLICLFIFGWCIFYNNVNPYEFMIDKYDECNRLAQDFQYRSMYITTMCADSHDSEHSWAKDCSMSSAVSIYWGSAGEHSTETWDANLVRRTSILWKDTRQTFTLRMEIVFVNDIQIWLLAAP